MELYLHPVTRLHYPAQRARLLVRTALNLWGCSYKIAQGAVTMVLGVRTIEA
jgi:hypothetical protein